MGPKLSRRERRFLPRKKPKESEVEASSEHESKHKQHVEHAKPKHSIIYTLFDKHYKKLILIPIFLIIVSILIIANTYTSIGDFIYKDVSLKGGLTLTVQTNKEINIDVLETQLSNRLGNRNVEARLLSKAGEKIGFLINSDLDVEDKQTFNLMISEIEANTGLKLTEDMYSVEFVGSSLGKSFFSDTLKAVFWAFVLMAIVVFITFKRVVPSLFVILAAVSDIICTLAFVNLMQIKITTAGVAAFLMLIGYSVDTDILLTTRVLKREGTDITKKIMNAMRTGLTMSLTSFTAIIIAYFFTPSELLKQIMLILAVGLIFDIINTWLQNAGILRLYLEKSKKKN